MSKGTDPVTNMHLGPTKQPDTYTGGRAEPKYARSEATSEKPGGAGADMVSANASMKKKRPLNGPGRA